jgi:1-acyl-sn-glycerol-3-phosphate acyltransferase
MSPSLTDDVRQLARGWRWTRRPLTPRSAEPWLPPAAPREFPTDWARTAAGRAVGRTLFDFGLRPLTWVTTAPRTYGLDQLEGLRAPVVFVANHASHLDTPVILGSLPKPWRDRTAVAAAADYFFDAWWRAATTALVLNTFPVERAGGGQATSTAERLIREEWNLVVYPEGTRSQDGWAGRFRHGAARLCLEYGLPCVPIAVRGSFAAMPRGRGWPIPGRPPISVRFGPPIAPRADEDLRSLSRRIQRGIARVYDEDASTWWESKRREADGLTPPMTGPAGPRWRRVWESTRPVARPERTRAWPR